MHILQKEGAKLESFMSFCVNFSHGSEIHWLDFVHHQRFFLGGPIFSTTKKVGEKKKKTKGRRQDKKKKKITIGGA